MQRAIAIRSRSKRPFTTGADLKRVVEEAKSLYAFDNATGVSHSTAEDYLLKAIESVALNKQRYAEANAQYPQRSDQQEIFFSAINANVG